MNENVAVPTDPIVGCITIDNSTTDNGYLGCNRAAYPRAKSHGSTEQAVNNLITCLGANENKQAINIIGHGDSGLIVTGLGDGIPDNPAKYIGLDNQNSWQPFISLLSNKGFTYLRLCGCHCGAGADGANFLYQIARNVNAEVWGSTGFVYCDNGIFEIDQGAVWQKATPTNKPNPIDPPSMMLTELIMESFKFNIQEKIVEFSKQEVVSISVKSNKPGKQLLLLNEAKSSKLLSLINFSNPVKIPGHPAGLPKGIVSIRLKKNGKESLKEYVVYNNRLLVDKESPTNAYYCSVGISEYL